ncbi:M48 family metalloprotease [Oceanospirillum sediminis]|uniref:M48 family metallopeptidase n=1 Tax=Oceanospirillum sediminis TaxID=2760088 RepID=A0A839IK52_9GAMM|nr:M48 family metalloprotease [Oceanospirillum sediminis]MBB1485555.1 M48 family metallopeptidase [Oceanospirillum sediminis]
MSVSTARRLSYRTKTLRTALNSGIQALFIPESALAIKAGMSRRVTWSKRRSIWSVKFQTLKKRLYAVPLVLALLAPSGALLAQTAELPDIGSNIPDTLTISQEYFLGRAWLRQFRAQTSIIYDPVFQDYLEKLTSKLAVEADLYERRLNLVAVKADTINAFAVPGGVIGVHSALLLQARDEDMVASVMAHELAHLSQRHYARSVEAAKEQQTSLFAMLLAGLVLSANGQGDAASAAIVSSQALAMQNRLRFSRLHEQEADAIGFEVLRKAGYDSRGMAQMFELLQEQSRTQGGNAPEFLLTHPLTQSRIAFAREREKASTDSQYSNLEFQLARSHALVHQVEGAGLVAARKALLDSVPDALKSAVGLYTDILLALKQDNNQQAAHLAEGLALQPDHLYFRLLKARVMAVSGRADQAIELLEAQLQQTPESYPVRSLLATYYRETGLAERSIKIYRELLDQRPEDPWLWQQLSLSARQAQNLLLVYQANAEQHQLTGDMSQALAELKLAKQSATEGSLEHARISHRMQELQQVFKRMKSGG